jgi:PAS domain S-box-containing protein
VTTAKQFSDVLARSTRKNSPARLHRDRSGVDAVLARIELDGELPPSAVLDALPAAIYTTDAEGTLTYFNRAAAELAGREPEVGKDRWCVTWRLRRADGSVLPHDECPMAQALKEQRPIRGVEAFAERPDGTLVPFAPYPTPIFDASGEMIGAVNMLVDISEQKEAEAVFRSTERAAQHLAAIVESSDDAIASKDLNGIIQTWNKGAERLFGYRAEEVVGKPITILIPDNLLDEEPRILARIRRGERVEHFETKRRRKDGSLVAISLTVSPVRDAEGRVVGASKIARDISERKRGEAALARHIAEQAALHRLTERLHRAKTLDEVYDAALDAIGEAFGCRRASILLFDSTDSMHFAAWRGLSDDYRQAVEGHSPWAPGIADPAPIYVDDVRDSDMPAALKKVVEAEGIRALAFVPLIGGGKLIGKFMAYYDAPHAFTGTERDLALTIARQLGFSIDRKEAEQQRALLVAELSHRVKNTLATVISIARQSFSTSSDPDEARQSFNARIRGLAQTHTRLAEANWSGMSLETLLADELAPYRDESGANVRLSGPAVTLSPKQALTLGMAAHELATNAAKYGALSNGSGKVDIRWALDRGAKRLDIRWIERGGPPVAPPSRRGFGRLLIERVLSADLGGSVDMDFADAGLECAISLPLDYRPAGE